MRSVPSLQSLQGEEEAEEQTFQEIYSMVTQKEGEINILTRKVSDFQEEVESLKLSQQVKLESLEAEKDEYIQTIIEMKMRCA